MVKSGNEKNFEFQLLKSVMQINDRQKLVILPKMRARLGNLKGKKIALWGLAFKPDTDDIREAPALYLIDKLVEEGASVSAFDPEAMGNVKRLIGDKITYAKNQYEALDGADCLLIATEWSEFRTPDFKRMNSLLKNRLIFDGRNLYEMDQMDELEYEYFSIGRGKNGK